MDRMTAEQRHRCMSRIRSKNTKPEWRVRRVVWSMGFRYRLHDRRLPGKPDLVLRKYRKVIFVHGCFWHAHGCSKRKAPEHNSDFWRKKFKRNLEREQQVLALLWKGGWKTLVIWECETNDEDGLRLKLAEFLGEPTGGTVPCYERPGAEEEYRVGNGDALDENFD